MDAQTVQAAAAVIVPCGLVAAWLLRLEGRVNTHEAECDQRQKRYDERHRSLSDKLDHMDAKLDRLVERA